MLDSGTNNQLINNNLMHLVTKYKAKQEKLVLADNSNIEILGRGSLGIFSKVANVARLSTPLISTKILCYEPFNFIVLHIDELAYIIDRYVNPTEGGAVITTASVQSDGLYHFDNILELINYPYKATERSNDYSSHLRALYGGAHPSTSETIKVEEIEKAVRKNQLSGGCQNKNSSCDVGLDPITLLHVKLGHASEKVIKWTVKNNTTSGLRYSYDQIKNAKLRF